MTIKKAREQGFTLVELLVVMAILAVLIAISVAGLGYAMRRSRNISRAASIENLQIAIEAFYSDEQEYPTLDVSDVAIDNIGDLVAPGGGTVLEPYIESAFDAPPDTEIYYRSDGQLYTVCVNQEVRGTTNYDFVCAGSGVDSPGYPTREISGGTCTNCAGVCTVWGGEAWTSTACTGLGS